MKNVKLQISGMSCQNCVRHVTTALKDLPGVSVDDVKIGSADVTVDDQRTSEQQVLEALRDAGYDARVS